VLIQECHPARACAKGGPQVDAVVMFARCFGTVAEGSGKIEALVVALIDLDVRE
jgi:hypothetical protein